MSSNHFSWGQIITRFSYDFDLRTCEVVKFYAHKFNENGHPVYDDSGRRVFEEVSSFHCEELSETFHSIEALLVAWIARKTLGQNQHALVAGICRALAIPDRS